MVILSELAVKTPEVLKPTYILYGKLWYSIEDKCLSFPMSCGIEVYAEWMKEHSYSQKETTLCIILLESSSISLVHDAQSIYFYFPFSNSIVLFNISLE